MMFWYRSEMRRLAASMTSGKLRLLQDDDSCGISGKFGAVYQ